MDRSELGAFLRSRRERLRPEDVGLSSGPRRRTPGLRREEVAVLAHISTEYYVRLEQARAPRPSGEVLAAIASALLLTDAESAHLHLLAGTAPLRSGTYAQVVRPSVLSLLDRLGSTAAMVVSAALDVLAWNPLAAALLEDFDRLEPSERNLARRAFLPPDPPAVAWYGMSDTPRFRQLLVQDLRRAYARYPSDPMITGLVADLRRGSSEFARLWERRDVQVPPMLTKTLHHPAVGELTLDCDTFALTDADQRLVLYSAPAGSRAADSLALLEVLRAEDLQAPPPSRRSGSAGPGRS